MPEFFDHFVIPECDGACFAIPNSGALAERFILFVLGISGSLVIGPSQGKKRGVVRRKYVVLHKPQGFVAESTAGSLVCVLLYKFTKHFRIDHMKSQTIRIHRARFQPATINLLLHFVGSNFQRSRQRMLRQPIASSPHSYTQSVQHRSDRA